MYGKHRAPPPSYMQSGRPLAAGPMIILGVIPVFPIVFLAGADIVVLIVFIALRLVLKERADQRLQQERAVAYFAARDQQYARQDAALREAVLGAIDQRAP